jgi:hypothetical protein
LSPISRAERKRSGGGEVGLRYYIQYDSHSPRLL